ncbi:unnamed protein product [Thelazia callipaeda]|uniref:FHA domain-containing protein n=1 Tax=Thelazia callipaeda TaxID=103827 RepID=A0A0N5CWW7_THECL|nr:unnamed protein product [Thelazia callipaeda]
MSSSTIEKAMFCFEFFVKSIEVFPESVNIQSLEIKFDDYEWLKISDEYWNDIGRRCYMIKNTNFLDRIADSTLRVQAVCTDESVFSADGVVANCKGIIKLYRVGESSKNLHVRVVMRIVNVDCAHLASFCLKSTVAVDEGTQTEWHHMNRRVQAVQKMRSIAMQTHHRKIKNIKNHILNGNNGKKDGSTQCSSKVSEQHLSQISNAITKILLQAAGEKKQPHLRNVQIMNSCKKPAKILVENEENCKESLLQNEYYRRELKKETEQCGKFPESNMSCRNADRSRPRRIDDEAELKSDTTLRKNSNDSYDIIYRKRMLRKLDQLIAQKLLAIQKINVIKIASQNKKPQQKKVERLCHIAGNSACYVPIYSDAFYPRRKRTRCNNKSTKATSKKLPSEKDIEKVCDSASRTSSLLSGNNCISAEAKTSQRHLAETSNSAARNSSERYLMVAKGCTDENMNQTSALFHNNYNDISINHENPTDSTHTISTERSTADEL